MEIFWRLCAVFSDMHRQTALSTSRRSPIEITIHPTSSAIKFSDSQRVHRAQQATAHRVPQQGKSQAQTRQVR